MSRLSATTLQLSQLGIRRPRWVIAISLLLMALAAYGLKDLSISADYRIFFSDDNPELLAFERQEALFYKSDTVVFGLKNQAGVLSKSALQAQQWLTEQAWQLPYVQRVDSVTNFQYSSASGDDLIVEDLVEDAAALDDAGLARVQQRAEDEPALKGRLLSESGQAALVVATVQLPGVDRRQEIPAVALIARDIRQQAQVRWPQFQLELMGMVPFNQTLSEATLHDLSLLWPASFLIMFLVLAWMLRGVVAVLITAAVIALSVVLAVGAAGWAGLVLSTATAAAPVIIMTLAIAHSVHLFVNFRQNIARGQNTELALSNSLASNLRPISLTSLTTIVGFLTLNFSDAPPFQALGTIVAVGVLVSWLAALWLLPALVTQFGVGRQVNESPQGLRPLGRWVTRHRRRLLPAFIFLCVPILLLLPRNEINDIYREWFDTSSSVRQGMEFALTEMGGLSTLHFTLDSGREQGVSDPAFYQVVDAFEHWLAQQPEVAHVNSYLPIIRRMNRVLTGDTPEQYRLPDNPDLAAQYLTIYELSLPFGQSLNNLLDLPKQRARVSATLKRVSSKQLLSLDRRATDWLADHAEVIAGAAGSGTPKMFAELGQRNIRSMLIGSGLALLLISFMLVFAFRSWRLGLLSVVPNMLPAALGFGLWALFNGQVNLALSVVMGMTLGIVVDDTIHFMSKYQYARQAQNKTSIEAVEYCFSTVGKSLWVTSVVLVLGFLVLAGSHFSPTADMGLLTAMVIALALVADFFLLPPLLMWVDKQRQ